MNIQRLLDIYRCKKSKYTVTLREAYRLPIDDQVKDFRTRIKINDQNQKIKYLLTLDSLAAMLALIFVYFMALITPIKTIDSNPIKTPVPPTKNIKAVQFLSFT